MVPPGTKGYWGKDAARGIMVYRHVTPPGSGHKNEPIPEGSHVSSMLGRKAHNGLMDIYYRKAQMA